MCMKNKQNRFSLMKAMYKEFITGQQFYASSSSTTTSDDGSHSYVHMIYGNGTYEDCFGDDSQNNEPWTAFDAK